MNARELHDNLEPSPASMISPSEGGSWVIQPGEDQATILRALDLLARVEESEDELVRELRGLSLLLAYRYLYEEEKTVDRAAASLVALKAERDRLKAHAEAMAEEIANQYGSGRNVLSVALDAYRRDFPKDAP